MQAIFDTYLPLVETEVNRALGGRGEALLYQMIRYHLGLDEPSLPSRQGSAAPLPSSGKRVRPTLCLLSCEAAGGSAELAAPAAAALELIHAFTLIHDDVADGDEVRRGRPTVWRRWGVGQAITAGDALYSLANLCLARLDGGRLGPELALAVHQEANAAVLAVCEGQQLDISFEGRMDVAVDDYLHMVGLKTGRLLAAAGAIGCLIGSAGVDTCEALRRFGHHLGLAFQIRDDILGIWGDPTEMGKPVGGDLLRRKRSLPVIHALSQAQNDPRPPDAGGTPALPAQAGEPVVERMAAGASSFEEAAALAAEMEAGGSRAYCEQVAGEALAAALAELDPLPLLPPHGARLRDLARHLAGRTR